jgi:glycerol-3-phosphate dehydrogenase
MNYDVAVIGCGVTGAAVAYTLARYNVSVVILEAENDVADATTKANSGLFHAGYDPEPGSDMARLNVEGTAAAKEICRKLDVPVKWCGSFVIGFTQNDMQTIRSLYDRGIKNKVPGMEILTARQTLNMEPALSTAVRGALYAPTAGVVSPWEYALAMAETAVRNGAELKRRFRVTAIKKAEQSRYVIQAQNGSQVQASYIVNAAGVYADKIHNMVSPAAFKILPKRGEYYLMDKTESDCVRRVIFQCPSKEGKGVLVSPTAHGNLLVGPNSENSEPDDTSCTAKGLQFVAETAKKSVPTLKFGSSIRNFAGVRANSDKDDFIIGEAEDAKGFIDLAGIKSPGLSSAAAVGVRCAELLEKAGLKLTERKTFIDTRTRIRFASLTPREKQELVTQNPKYGRIICRCETITEGEILDALASPIPPVSVDGVKRRCNTGMGRCQGGFCGPRVMEILMREAHINYKELLQDKDGSVILSGLTKKQPDPVGK